MRWVNGTGRMSPISTSRAVFSGSSGTVTVSGQVGAAGLSFQSGGYLITGGTIALASGSSRPSIDVAAGITGTVEAAISGTGGLAKTGAGTLAFSRPLGISGTVEVSAGRLAVSGSAALPQAMLSVSAGASVMLPDDPLYSLRVAGLAIDDAGGRLDVGPGHVTIAGGGITQAALVADLAAGRGTGYWDGTSGLVSRTAAATTAAGQNRGLGWIADVDGSFTVGFAAPGDTNIDGMIDILDAADVLSSGRFDSGAASTWTEGDFNYDGMVDVLDVADSLGTGLFDAGGYVTAGLAAGPVAAVPEPSSGWPGVAGLVAVVARACHGVRSAGRRNRRP